MVFCLQLSSVHRNRMSLILTTVAILHLFIACESKMAVSVARSTGSSAQQTSSTIALEVNTSLSERNLNKGKSEIIAEAAGGAGSIASTNGATIEAQADAALSAAIKTIYEQFGTSTTEISQASQAVFEGVTEWLIKKSGKSVEDSIKSTVQSVLTAIATNSTSSVNTQASLNGVFGYPSYTAVGGKTLSDLSSVVMAAIVGSYGNDSALNEVVKAAESQFTKAVTEKEVAGTSTSSSSGATTAPTPGDQGYTPSVPTNWVGPTTISNEVKQTDGTGIGSLSPSSGILRLDKIGDGFLLYRSGGMMTQALYLGERIEGEWSFSNTAIATSFGVADAAITPNGRAIIAWMDNNQVYYKFKGTHGWSATTNVGFTNLPASTSMLGVGISDDGTASILLKNDHSLFLGTHDGTTWSVSFLSANSLFKNVTDAGLSLYDAKLAYTNASNIIVLAVYASGGGNERVFRWQKIGGVTSSPTGSADYFGPNARNQGLRLASNKDGKAAALVICASQNFGVYFDGTSWTGSQLISVGDARPGEVSVGANGEALFVWTENGGPYFYKAEYKNSAWVVPTQISDAILNPNNSSWTGGITQPGTDLNGNAYTFVSNGIGAFSPVGRVFISQRSNGTWSHPSLTNYMSLAGVDASLFASGVADNGYVAVFYKGTANSESKLYLHEFK